jgi:hypothetical protein
VTAAELHSRVSERERAEVMGLRLVPFTIGHARLLEFLGCSTLMDAGDVALAVLVCSRPPERVLPFLRSRWMPLRLWVWRRYLKLWDVDATARQMADYWRRHTELPAMVFPGTSSGGSRNPIPEHQGLRVTLISRLGYRPEDIDGTPYLQALWDVATLAAQDGRANVLDMTNQDLADIDKSVDWDSVMETAKRQMGVK